jgi:hypothetical protein
MTFKADEPLEVRDVLTSGVYHTDHLLKWNPALDRPQRKGYTIFK